MKTAAAKKTSQTALPQGKPTAEVQKPLIPEAAPEAKTRGRENIYGPYVTAAIAELGSNEWKAVAKHAKEAMLKAKKTVNDQSLNMNAKKACGYHPKIRLSKVKPGTVHPAQGIEFDFEKIGEFIEKFGNSDAEQTSELLDALQDYGIDVGFMVGHVDRYIFLCNTMKELQASKVSPAEQVKQILAAMEK